MVKTSILYYDSKEEQKGMRHMKIVCVGDSITFGSGVRLTRSRNSYPSILARFVGKKFKVYNLGNPGRTLSSTGDFPYILEPEYRSSQELLADIYIILLGTNDTKPYNWDEEVFKKEYPEFVRSYKRLINHPKVILMLPPKAFPVEWNDNEVAYDIQGDLLENPVGTIIKDYAKEADLPLVDLYELTKKHPKWFVDGVHPNKKGNRAIAKEIYKCIIKNMKTPE